MRFGVGLVAGATALSACTTSAPLTRVAVEHNTLVARTTDEMMLTNILRARAREPMHFTSLSVLRGDISLSAEASLGGSFPGREEARTNAAGVVSDVITDAAETFTPGIKASVTTNPSFDLAINDSQEFYRGLLSPVEPSTVAHFLDDGWRPELITYLMVGRFDFVARKTVFKDFTESSEAADADTDAAKTQLAQEEKDHQGILFRKGQIVRSLRNIAKPDLNAVKDATKFKTFVSCFHLHPTRSKEDDTELMPLTSVDRLDSIDKLDGKAFDVKRTKKDGKTTLMLVRKGGEVDALELVPSGDVDEPFGPRADLCSADTVVTPSKDQKTAADQLDDSKVHFSYASGVTPANDFSLAHRSGDPFQAEGLYRYLGADNIRHPLHVGVRATIRSTEALLYFLGEYIRYSSADRFQMDPPSQGEVNECSKMLDQLKEADLFVITDSKPKKWVLSATLHDRTWWVPDNSVQCAGRTMEIIGLVEQLYNLQKNSKDKIGTQSVKLIQ